MICLEVGFEELTIANKAKFVLTSCIKHFFKSILREIAENCFVLPE